MNLLNRKFGASLGALTLAVATAAGTLATATPASADTGNAASDAAPGGTFSTTDQAPGWASQNGGTNGGAGADEDSTYTVSNRKELLAAFDNGGNRDEPKVIYVDGTIHGNEADDGTLLGEQDFAPGYDIDKFLSCFTEDAGWSDQTHDYCGDQRRLRINGSREMKIQTELSVPSNTTIVGLGDDAGFDQSTLMMHLAKNVVVRNLTIEAPIDYFSWWDQKGQSWDARFDAMAAVASTNIWVDHVTLTDGKHLDVDAEPGPDGDPVNRHDGLFDMKDGANFITLSNSHVTNHDKSMILGSGDDHLDTDEGKLKISFMGNFIDGIKQRSPYARYGQVHVVNNYFLGRVNDPEMPMDGGYFLGIGFLSQMYSERNSFDYTGPGASADIILSLNNGNHFTDEGSWYNQQPIDLTSMAAELYEDRVAEVTAAAEEKGEPVPAWATEGFSGVDWTPPYEYEALTTADAVERHARTETGVGKLVVAVP